MSLILPTGLTHLVPSDGTLVPISYTDITTSSGTVGPLTLQVSNTSNNASALFSYSAELNPTPPVPHLYHTHQGNPGESIYIAADVTIFDGTATAVPTASANTWSIGQSFGVNGNDIGGTYPTNNLSFLITELKNVVGGVGEVAALAYNAGVVPNGTDPIANAPTLGSPTKVFTVAPLTSQLIQIPSSSASLSTGPIDLVASGANLYVTPVQVIA